MNVVDRLRLLLVERFPKQSYEELLRVLDNPNRQMSGEELISALQWCWDHCGRYAVWLIPSKSGRLVEIRVLSPDRLRDLGDHSYSYQESCGTPINLPEEEVVVVNSGRSMPRGEPVEMSWIGNTGPCSFSERCGDLEQTYQFDSVEEMDRFLAKHHLGPYSHPCSAEPDVALTRGNTDDR